MNGKKGRRAERGFTLIELMIVTVIVGLLAGMAVPQFDQVRQRAFDAAAMADLRNAMSAIEQYFNENYAYPTSEDDLYAAGYSHTPGVSFTTFSIRDANDPDKARIHIHIEHAGSTHYYHEEYPSAASTLDYRWK